MKEDFNKSNIGISRRGFLVVGAEALAVASAGLATSGVALAQSETPQVKEKRTVTLDRQEGGLLLIGIDRQEKQNRYDPDTFTNLGKAIYQFDNDNDLRVAVLYGHGPNFCAGIDPETFPAALRSGKFPPKDPDFIHPLNLPISRQRSKPMVVAVQGLTERLGHELFLASDVRIAASDTTFSQSEATLGAFPALGGTIRFVHEAGWGNAMHYMLTGETWGVDEAKRMGLLLEVTPPGRQLDRAIEIARKIAASAPLGVRALLASAHQAQSSDSEKAAYAALGPEFVRLLQTEDAQEYQRALREHRVPVFHGR